MENSVVEIICCVDGLPVISEKDMRMPFAETTPWEKLSKPCECGSDRFFVYVGNNDYRRDCAACGLVSTYSGRVLNAQPEELEKCFKFPASKNLGKWDFKNEPSKFGFGEGVQISPQNL